MKVFVLLCALGAAFAAHEPSVHSCLEKPDGGMCLAYMPMYYYDPKTDKCEKFIYGGCQGNGNRYATEEQCLQHCSGVRVEQSSSDACSMEPEGGMCRGYFPMYYFDKKTGTCKEFIYGGCGGNENRFGTEQDCQEACAESDVVHSSSDVCSLEKKPGMCLAYIPRYYHNKETGRCEKFIYGGCQGNGNNFETLEECEATCPPAPLAALDRPDCDKGPETGNCMAYIPRFYYDQEAGMCKKFIYGGCGGNRNNFKDEAECYNRCGALYTQTACDQPMETGLCRGYFPRYYFNKETGKCETFIYGGCGGNDNNFNAQKDCEAVCAAPILRAPEHCHLQPETGPCRAMMPRYYYDAASGECKLFTYGGCKGNANNFQTEEDCKDSCSE